MQDALHSRSPRRLKKKEKLSCGQDHTAYLGRQNGQHIINSHVLKNNKKLHTVVQIKCILFCQ